MNRKNRKERLKRLNAQRKANRQVALSPNFKYRVHITPTEDLETILELMETEAIFDLHKKLEERIAYIKAVLKHREERKHWLQTPASRKVRFPSPWV